MHAAKRIDKRGTGQSIFPKRENGGTRIVIAPRETTNRSAAVCQRQRCSVQLAARRFLENLPEVPLTGLP